MITATIKATRATLIAALAAFALAAAPGAADAATITVDTGTDEYDAAPNATCSLREAIESSNTDADFGGCLAGGAYGEEVIGLPSGFFTMSLGSDGENANQEGDFDVTESVSISGQGSGPSCAGSQSCIDADGIDRAIDVRDGADPIRLTLGDLAIEDGMVGSPGGAIRSAEPDSVLALDSIVITQSEGSDGGAISSAGSLSISNSLLTNNLASGGGGAIDQDGGSLSVTSGVVSLNRALGADGGGGIRIDNGASGVIRRVELIANVAAAGDGGAVLNANGFLSLFDSGLDANRGVNGGGLAVHGAGNLAGTTLSSNLATGLCAAGNGRGGGLYLNSATGALALTNSTVSQNQSGCAGGGINVTAAVGLIALNQVTIAVNAAAGAGGGIALAGGGLNLRGSILAANVGGGAVSNCSGGGYGSGGRNIETASSCGMSAGTGDLVNTDPLLGPLRFNGGPTQTHQPLTTSPALNAIPDGCPASDQRGFVRPVAGLCDIGAVEVGPAPLCAGAPVTIAGNVKADKLSGTAGPDVIAGLGGNDVIVGLGGNDVICGGHGNDTLVGAGGNDRLRGEKGRDKLKGGPGRDVLEGGAGKDKLIGGKGKNKLRQ